ncbi:MAG: type I-E CRISPR-associated protein Cas5/CasD [Anaerolineae bacterium]|nr:type I-E CRISPR-associated protein Cas5/CasD [Anaerolineae bacterium]
MDTLLIRLIGPMQSWGVQSHYTVRDTGLEPSKSGVMGLLCAALGRPRQAPLEDLLVLRMGVRVDREGILSRDYHIAQDVLETDNKKIRESVVTNRYYLANAAFLVGFEGDPGILSELQAALQKPVWALFLGRKAFPPSAPIFLQDGLQAGKTLEQALMEYGWIVSWRKGEEPNQIRVVIDSNEGKQVRPDVPVSFATRRFASRRVNTFFIPAPTSPCIEVM